MLPHGCRCPGIVKQSRVTSSVFAQDCSRSFADFYLRVQPGLECTHIYFSSTVTFGIISFSIRDAVLCAQHELLGALIRANGP